MAGYTAQALYGWDPTAQQPTATATPDHQGAPEPTMATAAPASKAQNPIMAVVVLLGLVVLLTQVSFRGTVAVRG